MGGVNDRGSKPTKKFDSTELARLTKPDTDTEATLDDADEAFREWDEQPAGTPYLHAKPVAQPRPTLHIPAPGDLTRSRTATVHDPFTTGLLAEVARRSQTAELSPDQIKAATDDAADHEDEDKTPPVTSPRIIRR